MGAVLTLMPAVAMARDYTTDYSSDYSTTSTATSSAAAGGFAVMFIIFIILYIAFIVFCLVFWIMMLIDAAKRTNWKSESDKTLWIVVVALLGALGGAIYYFAVKRPLDKAAKK